MPHIPRPEHPRPDWERPAYLSLNGAWAFDFEPECASFDVKDLNLTRVITVPFSWASPLSGIHEDVKGAGWYMRAVRYAPERPDDALFIVFGAVDYACDVFVNGRRAGGHTGGYAPFRVDVTELWRHDEDNVIAVRCQDNDLDSQTRGKQSYGEIRGIWQSVYMESHPAAFLRCARFETHIDGLVTARCVAFSPTERALPVALDFGPDASYKGTVTLGAGETSFTLEMKVSNPKLWTPQTPHLYEGAVTLGEDMVRTYFGIREVGYARFTDEGIPYVTLNGSPVYLNGTLDQSFNPEGYFTLPDEEAVVREVALLKELGLNLDRIHIKPEEPRKLYWMDKLGVMVMQDMCCFWGEPGAAARGAWEQEMWDVMERDWNHPSVIAWVLFNETWGLFSHSGGARAYKEETQRWVADMVARARHIDNTRLIEDNSACNYDHVTGDINSWHFYINGYRAVKDHIAGVARAAFPGSPFNFIKPHVQPDVPLMNSECGMVWGVEDSAGDSDIAHQYRYMLNEYRLHARINGFVFTEFTDVINEFNGYYRIDRSAKEFGYDGLCPNMRIADLHAQDFIAIDAPPCQTAAVSQRVRVPLVHSNFDAATHGKTLTVQWALLYDGAQGRREHASGALSFAVKGFGATPLEALWAEMPPCEAVAVLALTLCDGDNVLSRNYTTFDVRGAARGAATRPCQPAAVRFETTWTALSGEKFNGAGSGYVEYALNTEGIDAAKPARLIFEAGAKRLLKKDLKHGGSLRPETAGDFMQGYRMDPGGNKNSYFMTDRNKHPSRITVSLNGALLGAFDLPDDPADARGVLSWHHQALDRILDEAGSYGWLISAHVPAGTLAPGAAALRIEAQEGGVALYGRNAGRYPVDIMLVQD